MEESRLVALFGLVWIAIVGIFMICQFIGMVITEIKWRCRMKTILFATTALLLSSAACFAQTYDPMANYYRMQQQQNQDMQLQEMQRQTRALENLADQQERMQHRPDRNNWIPQENILPKLRYR
jgi:apolipoprotein N-acyltransferase